MAYTTATVISKDPATQDGRVHIVVAFTGDAGEPTVQRDYVLDADTTVPALRTWVRDTIALLAGRKTIAAALTVGQVIPPAPGDPAPTAAELARRQYFANVGRLIHMQELVSAGGMLATNAEFTALQTTVKNAYLAAYATDF
jgi:hypothetical protein